MGTLAAVKNASQEDFRAIGGITDADAYNIYKYFHSDNDDTEN